MPGEAALLAEAGVEARILPDAVSDEILGSLQLLFVAGLPEGEARDLAVRARALRTVRGRRARWAAGDWCSSWPG